MSSLKDQLKEEVSTESQKMKEMSLEDKLWYIWEYYKFHIGAVLVLILLISVVITSVRNASIDPGLLRHHQQPLLSGTGHCPPGTGFF